MRKKDLRLASTKLPQRTVYKRVEVWLKYTPRLKFSYPGTRNCWTSIITSNQRAAGCGRDEVLATWPILDDVCAFGFECDLRLNNKQKNINAVNGESLKTSKAVKGTFCVCSSSSRVWKCGEEVCWSSSGNSKPLHSCDRPMFRGSRLQASAIPERPNEFDTIYLAWNGEDNDIG